MAQTMAYHRHPQSYNGHIYYWDNILNKNYVPLYILSGDVEAGKAYSVADLVHDIGELVHMNYGVDGSSAKMSECPLALLKLGYMCSSVKDFDYSDVAQSIRLNGPVLMCGNNVYNGMGHAWVVDGSYSKHKLYSYYKAGTWEKVKTKRGLDENYIHCNWGWGGSGNGYFLTDALSPIPEECLYTSGLKMITNITVK